jgi:3-methyladenine DNA glycosylase/8-oxoguanine DNA glycosylase
MQERIWRPDWPCSVVGALFPHRRGAGDPTFTIDEDRTVWRGIRTPEGPTTLSVRSRPREGDVHAKAWGPGAGWVLDSLPALLGAEDDWSGFEPRHPVLEEVRRHHPHVRIGRTGLVMEALVPAIIEQKVTGKEAFGGFRALVHRFGERAPGPGRDRRLWVQPAPDTLRTIPSWEWLRMHVDPARSRAVVTVARVAESLERTTRVSPGEADRRLRSIPGIGVWTSAEVRQRAFGDPDAVSFGDYHVAKDVGWALTGTPFTDEQLEDYLEPWRPQRGRVPMLVAVGGLRRPRHGPRMSLPTHYPGRS